MPKSDCRSTVPPFDPAGIRARIKRLNELIGRFSVESLYVLQQRVPLKPDEIKEYSGALFLALADLERAKAELEKAEARVVKISR